MRISLSMSGLWVPQAGQREEHFIIACSDPGPRAWGRGRGGGGGNRGGTAAQVACVQSVSEVDGSDKLYKTAVEVAGGETRQV